MHYLVFDISNLLYRTFHKSINEDANTSAGLAMHTAFLTLNKYFKQFKPDRVAMAFDRNSWRKTYTASNACVSGRPYKGNRRQNFTPSQQLKYQQFLHHLAELEKLIANQTTVITLACEGLEADDLIAGLCQQLPSTNKITIISTDTDLLQLLKHPNVQIYSPSTNEFSSLVEYNNDPNYYVFHKCMRGDPTDNIMSALPRIRSTKILEAYNDEYKLANLMEQKWQGLVGDTPTEFTVKHLFKENQLLIDLTKQPSSVRGLIEDIVNESIDQHRSFSLFHVMKFLGAYELNEIRDSIDQYITLLSR